MNQLPLFTFGTLCRGRRNHVALAGSYARVLPAVLPGFARLHPLMIGRRDGKAVDGELFFIRAETYTDTLAACDRLEGIPPGDTVGKRYRRMQVTVETAEGRHAAWAYVHRDNLPE